MDNIYMKTIKLFAVIIFGLQIAACSGPSYVYQSSSYNVDALRLNNANSCRVGNILNAETRDVEDPISFRGLSSFVSPVGDTYGDYITRALKDELMLAGIYSENSPLEISGTMTKHIFDASGTNVGVGDIAVEFVVTSAGTIVYKKTHSVHKEYVTGFNGIEASTNMQRAHTETVEELLNRFYKDPEFIRVMRTGASYQ
jgi:hypothetical protein